MITHGDRQKENRLDVLVPFDVVNIESHETCGERRRVGEKEKNIKMKAERLIISISSSERVERFLMRKFFFSHRDGRLKASSNVLINRHDASISFPIDNRLNDF